MTATLETSPGAGWRKTGALLLVVVALGLPINSLAGYVPLAVAAVLIFTGDVRTRPKAWLAALGLVVLAVAAQIWLAPPRIEEGHNVFLPGAQGEALRRGLPAEVYARLAQEFDAVYPPAVRCQPDADGCWQRHGVPARAYAFSADGIWHKTEASRSLTALDFADPVWLHLGFINEIAYNWLTAAPDVHRNDRDRRAFAGLQRWSVAMPWFEMIRLPGPYVGGELCWRGEILWEGEGERFSRWPGGGCRTIAPADAGRRVFGIAIAPNALAMTLTPPWTVRLLRWAQAGAILMAAVALVACLVRIRRRPALLAFALLGLAVAVIAVDDASFLGGMRPFDGGDDGLAYDGLGRTTLRHLLNGDIWNFLRGDESVYWYAPGLRYFRAFEHIVFGETYLGYLSLVLALPFFAYALFRRFLSERWALALVILFVGSPLGLLFGTSFFQYAKWASRGFADPAAYILLVAGILPIVGTRDGLYRDFTHGFCGALLISLAVFMKPVVCLSAMVLLTGAGLAALAERQWSRLAGMVIATFPVFWMPFHNLYFGHAFILFSSNVGEPQNLVMPPSAYVRVARQLFAFDFGGIVQVLRQVANWLSGPAESYWTIPLNAAGAIILVYVVVRGRRFDPWLRLIGAAALAQHAVALFYRGDVARYHFLSWFLTMLVVMVYCREVALPWFVRRYPGLAQRLAAHPVAVRLASGLRRLQEVSA